MVVVSVWKDPEKEEDLGDWIEVRRRDGRGNRETWKEDILTVSESVTRCPKSKTWTIRWVKSFR
jgi:hypothetical protein